jgi:2-(1,2-epoxy-1,2-dihydrophenyl)acetyl-CoA isomerase
LAEADDVSAILLTGAGNAFCAGGDVRAQSERAERAASGAAGSAGAGPAGASSVEDRIDELRRNQRAVSLALHTHPKVTIAALPGAAAGAGLSIALACDLRIAAASAFITTAFVKVGFSGDFGGSWFLTQLIGAAKARELYLTSDRVAAEECLRLGIVNRVVPDATFRDDAAAWAAGFATGPTLAYRYVKENINRALAADLDTCLDAEAVAMTLTGASEDHREAARAFVEKRQAAFTGR